MRDYIKRGTLFYEYARFVEEIQPKVFIYKNARYMINHNNGNIWEIIKGIFMNLGYKIKYEILNAYDYGIPQTRRRLFVVGYKDEKNLIFPLISHVSKYKLKDFSLNECKFGKFKSDGNGELIVPHVPGTIDPKYILTPKLYPYVIKSGIKTWYQNLLLI